MSSMEPGSPARPARIAGFVLLAVAVVALVMGVVSLIPSGNEAPPSTQPPATTTASGTSQPSATTAPPKTTTTTTQPPPPVTTTQAPPPPPGNGQQAQAIPLRVYNNSTIAKLATHAADDFKNNGWNVTSVANYSQGIIDTTTVYYRPGTDEENAAKTLAQRFRLRVLPRFDGIAAAEPGVIVIVTNDYPGPPSDKG
jgi:LytR cell envelope-related transcriptional attenuator